MSVSYIYYCDNISAAAIDIRINAQKLTVKRKIEYKSGNTVHKPILDKSLFSGLFRLYAYTLLYNLNLVYTNLRIVGKV